MNNLYFESKNNILDIQVYGGSLFDNVVTDAIDLANQLSCIIRFEFNGTKYIVDANTDKDKMIDNFYKTFR